MHNTDSTIYMKHIISIFNESQLYVAKDKDEQIDSEDIKGDENKGVEIEQPRE